VRQALHGVALELDAFLEVDEVKLDLLGAAREREVGDDDVKSVDFPEPVLPAKSACWRVPLPIGEELASSSRPVRPIGMRSSFVVSFAHRAAGSGTICEKGTSTRFESMLLLPIR
jgi:hypothetical protein